MKMFGFDTLDWRQIKIDWDAITDDIIKAGTPMDKDGHICNDGNVFGILMDDVQRKRNVQGRVVISGCMDMKAAEKHSGITLSAEAKAALPDVWTQSGASSWNDLTDKPFGETVVSGDTLTWDGNTDGLVSVWGVGFKVSDAVITKEDCANGLSLTFAGQTMTVPGEDVQAMFADDGFCNLEYAVFVPTDNYAAGGDLVFPKAGVYFASADGMAVTELVIPGYTFTIIEIEKLNQKFLPTTRMVVNFTKLDINFTTAKADKSVARIIAAVNAGIYVEGRIVSEGYTYILPLVSSPVDAAGLTAGSLAFCSVLNGTTVMTISYATRNEDGIEMYVVDFV